MTQYALISFDHFNIALPHSRIKHIEPWSDSRIETDSNSSYLNHRVIEKNRISLPVLSLNSSLHPSFQISEQANIIIFLYGVSMGIACNALKTVSLDKETPLPLMMKQQDTCISALGMTQSGLIIILNELKFCERLEAFENNLEKPNPETNLFNSRVSNQCNDMHGI